MSQPLGLTGRFHVQPTRLQVLSLDWRRQEWDLRSARDALAAVPPGALAAIGLGGFLDAWAAEIGGLAAAVGSVAAGLESAGNDFADVDRTVGDR